MIINYLCNKIYNFLLNIHNLDMNKSLKSITKYALIIGSILFAGCVEDVFQPDDTDPDKPGVDETPDNINWSTTQTSKLTVNVADQYDGKYYYTVEVYIENPAINKEAKILAGSGQKTNSKVPYSREIVIPDGTSTVYICVTDPFKRKSVYGLDVVEGDMTCNIGQTTQTKSNTPQLRSMEANMPTVDYSYKESECIILSDNNDNKKGVTLATGKKYLIKKGTKFTRGVTFPGDGKTTLYVEGSWEWNGNNDVQLDNGISIYVLTNGEVVKGSGNGKVSLTSTSKIAIQKDGKFGSDKNNDKFSFYMTSTSIVNEGAFYANNIDMDSNAKIYNANSFEVDKLTTENDGCQIVNLREFEADQISLKNGVIDNFCKFVVNTKLDVPANGKINLAPYAYMNVKQLNAEGLTLSMDAKSMWVGEDAYFGGQKSFVMGSGTDYALFKITNLVRIQQYSGLILEYSGKVDVECAGHQGNPSEFDKCYKLSGEASMSIGQSPVEIPANDCNDNGGNQNPGTGDGDGDGSLEEGSTLPFTYMFEDNWPAQGDYDMNDLVMTVEIRNTTEGSKTKSTKIISTLLAVGGTKQLGVAFQLDGIPASAISGAETGQTNAVVSLFDDAHQTLGAAPGESANTYNLTYPFKTIEKVITFNQPISGVINANNFNLFIVWGGMDVAKRNEIHLSGFKGTDKAASNPEASSETYISKATGWMWALAIAQTQSITYPKETSSIEKSYTGFGSWIKGDPTPNWYNTPVEGKVITIPNAE